MTERTKDDDHDLADEVRRSLRRRAAALDVPEVPFDRDGVAGLETGAMDDFVTAPRRSGWSRVALAAAVLLVVVGVGAAVGVVLDDGTAERADTDDATSGPVAPTTRPSGPIAADDGPGLLPAAPEGLDPWALHWGPEVLEQPALAQLFAGRGTGARILVVIHPGTESTAATTVTVRGRPGTTYPSSADPDRSTVLAWEEDGALVAAEYRGVDEADVVAFLNGLERRTDAPAGGYASPVDGPVDLVGEVEGGRATVRVTSIAYRDRVESVGAGVGEQVTVRAGRPDAPTIDTLRDRYRGTTDDDGRTVHEDPDAGVLRWTEEDGTWVEVDANRTVDDLDDLAAVAATVEEVPSADLVALRTAIEDRVAAAVPVVAEVGIDGPDDEGRAIVELRSVGSVEAVCLVVAGHPRRCSGADGDRDDQGSFLLDGRWYVVGVGREVVPITTEPTSATGPAPPSVDGVRRGEGDGWHASLAQLGPGVDVVYVGDEIQGLVVRRPGV